MYQVHKMFLTSLVINIFHETCTIGFSTHRAINLCHKLNFYEISRVVPFLIVGHNYAIQWNWSHPRILMCILGIIRKLYSSCTHIESKSRGLSCNESLEQNVRVVLWLNINLKDIWKSHQVWKNIAAPLYHFLVISLVAHICTLFIIGLTVKAMFKFWRVHFLCERG